jgi:hypothetical protein
MVAAAGLAQWCQELRRTGAFLGLTPVHLAAQDGGPGLGAWALAPSPGRVTDDTQPRIDWRRRRLGHGRRHCGRHYQQQQVHGRGGACGVPSAPAGAGPGVDPCPRPRRSHRPQPSDAEPAADRAPPQEWAARRPVCAGVGGVGQPSLLDRGLGGARPLAEPAADGHLVQVDDDQERPHRVSHLLVAWASGNRRLARPGRRQVVLTCRK